MSNSFNAKVKNASRPPRSAGILNFRVESNSYIVSVKGISFRFSLYFWMIFSSLWQAFSKLPKDAIKVSIYYFVTTIPNSNKM